MPGWQGFELVAVRQGQGAQGMADRAPLLHQQDVGIYGGGLKDARPQVYQQQRLPAGQEAAQGLAVVGAQPLVGGDVAQQALRFEQLQAAFVKQGVDIARAGKGDIALVFVEIGILHGPVARQGFL